MDDARSLERFLQGQAEVYPHALAELRAGDKQSHWMWFIFPQIAGLGRSPTAQFYAIADRAEAQAYSQHAVLGARLRECTEAMLHWSAKRTARDILGSVDALKFRSSMTLFEACAPDPALFTSTLDTFCQGERDQATLVRL